MSAITARDLRAAAASVRGARSAGITTAAAAAAPGLLAEAEKVLDRMIDRAQISGGDYIAQAGRYSASASAAPKALAYAEALEDLRAALKEG